MVGIDQVLEKLSTVIDPDLKKDIVSMGMIKDLELNDGNLKFTLELTTPACPFNVEIEDDVRKAIADITELKNFDLKVTAKVMEGVPLRMILECQLSRTLLVLPVEKVESENQLFH